MAIKGMTDRGLAFPQIGTIRKGSPKQKIQKDGREYEIQGKDLKHFRVEFDEQEAQAQATFKELYGAEPQALRCTFPFNEIDRVWDAYLEAYTASRLIARSDGEIILYWREGKEILVKNGKATADRTMNIWKKTEGKHTEPLVVTMKTDQPVPFVDGMVFHRTEKTIVEAKPVGRLRVTLYELKRLGYLLLSTTSVNDIIAIGGPDSGELGAIKVLCNQLGIPFAGVPLILRRKPKDISYTDQNGKQSRMKRWLLHIEADPEFVERALAKSRELAMPVVTLLSPTAESIKGVNEPEELEEDEIPTGEVSDVEEGEIVTEVKPEAPAPAPVVEEKKYRFNTGEIIMVFEQTMGITRNEAATAVFEARKRETDPLPEFVTITEARAFCAKVMGVQV